MTSGAKNTDGKYVLTLANGDTITITATATGVKNVSDTAVDNNTFTYVVSNASSYKTVTQETGDLSITKRDVILTSESGSKAYDGTALTKPDVKVTGSGFVTGEASDIKATGSVTTVEQGKVKNTIEFTQGTDFDENNYTIQKN